MSTRLNVPAWVDCSTRPRQFSESARQTDTKANARLRSKTPPLPRWHREKSRFRSASASCRDEDGCIAADQTDFARQLLQAAQDGADRDAAALGFHRAVAALVAEICHEIREETGENRVALSGGVFANLLLLSDCL